MSAHEEITRLRRRIADLEAQAATPSVQAETVAATILEGFSGPYYATGKDAHAARIRIIRDAARAVTPIIAKQG